MLLDVRKVSRLFGAKAAVDDISFSVERSGFIGVIGRSGAGKSTFLRIMNRLTDATKGEILFDGRNILGLSGAAKRDWQSQCAMIFQQFNLVPRMDVVSNVLHGTLAHRSTLSTMFGFWPDDDVLKALAILDRLGISEQAAKRAEALSGGQQQRVAIARALVQEPEIILADEPIASLDPRNTKIVMDSLLRLNKHFGITVVCNLHDLDIAKDYCNRLIGMAQGRIVFDGAPEALDEHAARELYGLEAHEAMTVLPPSHAGVGAQPLPAVA